MVFGILFDSEKEAERYFLLRSLEQRKKISKLECQKKFELLPDFEYQGCKIRGFAYIADFAYLDADGNVVVEDVKGYKTDVYRLKRKLFLAQYGHIRFCEVVDVGRS